MKKFSVAPVGSILKQPDKRATVAVVSRSAQVTTSAKIGFELNVVVLSLASIVTRTAITKEVRKSRKY